jgi:hypothetical protein
MKAVKVSDEPKFDSLRAQDVSRQQFEDTSQDLTEVELLSSNCIFV